MPYSKLSEANPSLRGIKPPITLMQANMIANMADSVENVESKFAVAISTFKKSHMAKDGKWIKKEGSEFGSKKEVPPPCLGVKMLDDVMIINEEVNIKLDLGMSRGVKAVTSPDGQRYLVLWTANAFEDREKETFATKSLEDYVARADRTKERGRVWFWHVKGTDFADVVWQGVHGRFLLEVAKPDDSEYATKMMHAIDNPEEFSDLLPHGWGTSHGFLWHPAYKDDNVFSLMHKYESTVLPAHRASNLYGSIVSLLGGMIMSKVSKEKAAGLVALVGEETAKELLDMTKQATDLLEEKGIGWKEFADAEKAKGKPPVATPPTKPPSDSDEDEEDDEDEEEEETEGGTKEVDGDVFEMELTGDLMKEIASNVDVKGQVKEAIEEMLPPIVEQMQTSLLGAVKEVIEQTTASTKEEIVQQAISGKLVLKPFVASKDDDNIVPDKDKEELLKAAGEKEEKSSADTLVSGLVAGMMQGTIG